ncbi:MAG: M48 family metallopeptidase [Bryobacterales bacterium]|nr:M48 family metallopeptidase [Bryobacterales bacterium]
MPVRGGYFDGRSSARQTVTVHVAGEGLRVTHEDGRVELWPFHSYRVQRSPADRFVRIERAPYLGECLLVEEPESVPQLLDQLRQRAPSAGRAWRMAMGLAAGVAASGLALYLAFPLLVGLVTRLAPVSFEEKLGSAVSQSLSPESERVRSASISTAMQRIVNRLSPVSEGGYTYRVSVARDPMVNAWAAPGGYVNVYCGLLERLESGDELAAILAHEFQHVSQRHSTRNLVRTMLIRAGLSLTGTGGDALFDTAAMFGALHMMRSDESAADAGGLDLLRRARIDPRAMAAAFERIDKESNALPGALEYLSTHPSTQSRMEAARAAAARDGGRYEPVMTPAEWRGVREACYPRTGKGSGR